MQNKCMKRLLKTFILVIAIITVTLGTGLVVYAADTFSVVMNYNGVTYTKELYNIEIEMIKNDLYTDGLKNIGEMCDNVAVITGGAVNVDKAVVIATVKNAVKSDKASISIDLSKCTNEAIKEKQMAAFQAMADSLNEEAKEEAATVNNGPVVYSEPVNTISNVPNTYSKAMNDYYGKSVFVGDSIMVGFRNYAMHNKGSFLNSSKFLSAVSYSLRNALRESSSLHPSYKGAKRPVWESISMMEDVDRVFIMFGMNDISIVGVDKSCENFVDFIGKIKEKKPNIEINVISMTGVLAGHEGKGLSNKGVDEFNNKMKGLCRNNGWGYCDLAPLLKDENGALASVYCSDKFVHMTNKAYAEAWEPFFYQYATLNGVK